VTVRRSGKFKLVRPGRMQLRIQRCARPFAPRCVSDWWNMLAVQKKGKKSAELACRAGDVQTPQRVPSVEIINMFWNERIFSNVSIAQW
jgi:hypothetical protein